MKAILLLLLAALPLQAQTVEDMLDGKDPVRAQMLKAIAAFDAQDAARTVAEADKTLALDKERHSLKPGELGRLLSLKGTALLFMNKEKAALPVLEKASTLTHDSRTYYNLACAQAAAKKLPEAEASLRKALTTKDTRFGAAAEWLEHSKTDAQLAPLRARPAYKKLLAEFGDAQRIR